MTRAYRDILPLLAAAFILGGLVLAAPPGMAESKKTATSSPVGGAFALIDHTGKPVTEKSWPGKHKLVFFGFTHCPEICPMTLTRIAEAMDKDKSAFENVQVLFITTDPARDTAEVMKAYVVNFNPAMTGLTGDEKNIKDVETAYKVYSAKRSIDDGKDYTMDHSAFIYLMSPDDKMLEIIRSETAPEEIAAKMKAHF